MANAKVISISDQNTTNLDTPSYSKSVIFVEPLGKTNPDGSVFSQPVDNKELFIYADLTAARKKRTIIQITDESKKTRSVNTSEVEVNLIGYREGLNGVGSKTMTTDWSHKPNLNKSGVQGTVTDLSPNSNIFEGFGVESIDINITAMNPPSVKIKFIDVRGGGLFDQETFNPEVEQINAFQNSTSPYSIFFELPPPKFYLTLKGFYGNPVTLCLYLIKWQGTFNSETGNFEMNADFLGYTFSFLQDIKIGHLIGVGNTDEGKKKLLEISYNPTIEGRTFPPITLDELAVRFQRITIKREEAQKNSKSFQKLKVINEQINFIKNLRTILGYSSTLLPPNVIIGANVNPSLIKVNTQQIFFRDVGVFAKTSNGETDGIVETNFKELYKNVETILKKYIDLKEGYSNDFVNKGLITQSELQFPESLTSVKNERPNIGETLTEVNRIILENEPDGKVPIITTKDFSGATKNNWPSDTGFYILNLKNTRDVINSKLNILLEAKSTQEKLIGEEFNKTIIDILGFTPTISNIIGILCNNIEMFLERIYDIGLLSQNKNDARVALLNGYINDSPSNELKTKVYPFPKVIDSKYKETYIGNISGINEDAFPEINFVDTICDGLVYSIKQATELNQSLQNIKTYSDVYSFPINANDVDVNLYIGLDYLPANRDGTINSEVTRTIIKRAFITYALSKYKNESFYKIAEFEAINLYDTFNNDTFKDFFKQLSDDQNNPNSLLQLAIKNNIILENSDGVSYKFETENLYENSFKIDNTKTLWVVDINLKEDLKFDSNVDNTKFKSPKQSTTFIKRYYDENLTYLNKSYLTLGTFKSDDIKGKLKGEKSLDTSNILETSTFGDFLTTKAESGNFYFDVKRTAQNSQKNVPLTKSSIYLTGNTVANRYSQAYLILSSFLFDTEKVLTDEIGDDYTKIIRLPYLYTLWLGANSYRATRTNEILSFNSEFPTVSKNNFYYVTEKTDKEISNFQFISLFQEQFETWVQSSDFDTLRNNLENILNTENLSETQRTLSINEINRVALKEIDLLIYDSTWTVNGLSARTETVKKEDLSGYLKKFMTSYYEIYKTKRGTNTSDKKEEKNPNQPVVTDKDIKYAFYIDLKQIYDNWIAGNENSSTYNCCKTTPKRPDGKKDKLYDLFKFVDKFRNETAGDAIININSFNDLVSKKDTGLYSFISKVLTDSYFMHFSLPFYVDFQNADEVANIFEPQDTLKFIRNTPTLLCVYNGPPSTTLQSSSNYGNDSFKFTDQNRPEALFGRKQDQKNTYLVAFNVNYGSQTQSIFKNVSVGTQESKVTGEYMTTLSNFILGTGESKPLLKDNSLFPVMRNRSYTASIQMMGDMMIQPQMYFQLNNIPFFSGSYMIMNVSHQIRPNNMYTTFKGVRQNRSPVTIITEPITFLSFQFDKGIYSSTTININPNVDLVTENQSANKTPVLDNTILENYKPITGTNILKSYDPTFRHLGIDIQVTDASTQIFSANKNGTVLINSVGNDLVSGYLIIEHGEESDGYIYYTGYFGIINNNSTNGSAVTPKTFVGLPSQYTATTTVPAQVNPSNPNSTSNQESQIQSEQVIKEVKNYYHYEVMRTKTKINGYDEYLNSPNVEKLDPQAFSSTLDIKIESGAVHNNSIFGN